MTLFDLVRKQSENGQTDPTRTRAEGGVVLRFVRELEQGKKTLRIDKVNQVLQLFGFEVGAVPKPRD
jgi:hypothetical protein